jgi:hypothetical protein
MLRRPRRRDAAPPPAALRGRSRSSNSFAVLGAGVVDALSRPSAARPTAAAAWRGRGCGCRGRKRLVTSGSGLSEGGSGLERVASRSSGGLARVGPAQRLPQLQRPGEGAARCRRPSSAELNEGPPTAAALRRQRKTYECGDFFFTAA